MLYNRLHLPVYTSLAAEMAASKRAKKSRLGFGLPLRARQPPTNNETLSQLIHMHPLPSIVMEWRRIHAVLEKSFGGLVNACQAAIDRHMVVSSLRPFFDLISLTDLMQKGGECTHRLCV